MEWDITTDGENLTDKDRYHSEVGGDFIQQTPESSL